MFTNRMFLSSLLGVNYSGGTNTMDPVTLNPYVYFQTYNTSFLNPSSPSLNDPITELYRYNDSLFTATTGNGSTECTPRWSSLDSKNMLYFSGVGTCFPPPCTGCSTYYTTEQDVSFIYQSGYSYTIYFVGKPLSGDSGNVFTDFDDFGGGGTSLYVDNNTVYFTSTEPLFPVSNPLYTIPIEINSSPSELENKNLRIFSIRAQDTFDTVTNVSYSYVNGIQTTAVTQSNLSTTTLPSGFLMSLGVSDLGTNSPYKGYFTELIIFNELHTLDTHTKVINFLKERWGIS